jgi:hypothetical protein
VSHRSTGVVPRTAVIASGTQGIGIEIINPLATRNVTIYLSDQSVETANSAASENGLATMEVVIDLADPESITASLVGVGSVDYSIIGPIVEDGNTIANCRIARVVRLVTLKFVNYAESIHAPRDPFTTNVSIVLFGGLTIHCPHPGTKTVSGVNDSITGPPAVWPPNVRRSALMRCTTETTTATRSGKVRTRTTSPRVPWWDESSAWMRSWSRLNSRSTSSESNSPSRPTGFSSWCEANQRCVARNEVTCIT